MGPVLDGCASDCPAGAAVAAGFMRRLDKDDEGYVTLASFCSIIAGKGKIGESKWSMLR